MFLDPTFLLLIPALIFSVWTQARVRGTFAHYSRVLASSRLTGAEVAHRILRQAGLDDVAIEQTRTTLGDHYDPRQRVLRLSPDVYGGRSVAALGVAAHEVGHAIQHDVGYLPLSIRNSIVPVASIGTNAGPWLFFIGLIFASNLLMDIGIYLFAGAVLFYFVTLPVEYNASGRALELLEAGGYITREEIVPARNVLQAAGLTYVAAATVAVSQLVRLLILRGQRDD